MRKVRTLIGTSSQALAIALVVSSGALVWVGCSADMLGDEDASDTSSDLRRRRQRCGDGRCGGGETCSSCPSDCGGCPADDGPLTPAPTTPADSGGPPPGSSSGATSSGGPPSASGGIAARYPNDTGIAADPAVIFADDFESYGAVSALTSGGRWDSAFHAPNIRLATESGSVFAGQKAVELTLPRTNGEVSNELVKTINPPQDTVFVRFYAKFDAGFNVAGSSHNGVMIQASYWDGPGSGPGIKADGTNKFLVSFEASREASGPANPGSLNMYVYHPGQRDVWGDHFFPTGRVIPFDQVKGDFGPSFVARPEIVPELGRWYAYEVMVQANTPGQRDGKISAWLDGALIAEFPNMRFRDTADLKIDRVVMTLHGNGGILATSKKWYDNVVIAKSYVGPMVR